jgi:hypothetical protein
MERKNLGIAIVSLLGVVGVLIACSASSNTASAISGGSTATAGSVGSKSSQGTSHFKVGQQVKLGNYIVTANSFVTNPGDDFSQPKSGNEFVVVDVTIKNTSTSPEDISSLLNFTFQDSTGQKYDETIISSLTAPDGTIPAGGLLRGQLPYEVPATQKSFTLIFQPDAFGTDQAVWNLSL